MGKQGDQPAIELTDIYREVQALRELVEGHAQARRPLPPDVVEELAEYQEEIRFYRQTIDDIFQHGDRLTWIRLHVALQDYSPALRDIQWRKPCVDAVAQAVAATSQGEKPTTVLASLAIGPVNRLAQSRRLRPGQV